MSACATSFTRFQLSEALDPKLGREEILERGRRNNGYFLAVEKRLVNILKNINYNYFHVVVPNINITINIFYL